MRAQLNVEDDLQQTNVEGTMQSQLRSSMPRILLVETNRWALTARLGQALCGLGSRVAVVCPLPGHPITKVHGLERVYRYIGRRPLESLAAAIEEFDPDIVIPFCDWSVQHLHQLHARAGAKTRALIERSLGPAESFSIVSSRHELLKLAAGEGVRVPPTVRVDSLADLKNWREELPWLLKADGTWGGHGVKKAVNEREGEQAFSELTRRSGVFELSKQLILNRDRDWIVANWRRETPGVIAQRFIEGRPANCTVVAWHGEVLAGIAVEVVQSVGPCQPATIVQVVKGQEMMEAARRIASRLGLSGFFGLDFMIQRRTGDPYLIELNPRCTPPCSVSLGEGRDLASALHAKLTNQCTHHRPPLTQKNRIAYFPHAMQLSRDASDAAQMRTACLDIPDNEPELVEELLHPWSGRSVTGRLLDRLRTRFSASTAESTCVFELTESGNSDETEEVSAGQPGDSEDGYIRAMESARWAFPVGTQSQSKSLA